MGVSTQSKTNAMAIISLISGLVSWFFIPFLAAVVAIITGHIARGQIKNGTETGDGLAIAGLILGYLNIAMSCVGVLIFILIFGGMIGLTGCAILADSASYVPSGNVVPPIP